jgi:hypothetical protein
MTLMDNSPAKTFLEGLGFEPCGINPDARQQGLWLRQQGTLHILISIPTDACISDVIDAIFHAGAESQRAHIAQQYSDLLVSMRVVNLPPRHPSPRPKIPA